MDSTPRPPNLAADQLCRLDRTDVESRTPPGGRPEPLADTSQLFLTSFSQRSTSIRICAGDHNARLDFTCSIHKKNPCHRRSHLSIEINFDNIQGGM